MKSFEQQVVEAIKDLTGIDMPSERSPNYNFYIDQDGNGFRFSASELTAEFQHKDGTLLGEGYARMYREGDWQLHRVVEGDGYIFRYRLCKAMEGSGYEAYIVGTVDYTNENNHEEVKTRALTSLGHLTREYPRYD